MAARSRGSRRSSRARPGSKRAASRRARWTTDKSLPRQTVGRPCRFGYVGQVARLYVNLSPRVSEPVSDEAARRGVDPEELVVEVIAERFSPTHPFGIVGPSTSGRSVGSEHLDEEIYAILGWDSVSTVRTNRIVRHGPTGR